MLASETETYAAEERFPSVDAGWMAELERLDTPMVFKSGAQAERAARTLAKRVIDAGESAEMIIHLRDGALAGRFVAKPAVSPGGAAEMGQPDAGEDASRGEAGLSLRGGGRRGVGRKPVRRLSVRRALSGRAAFSGLTTFSRARLLGVGWP